MDDPLYQEAQDVARQLGYASVSLIQRKMRIGYTRAARLVDMMAENGFCEKEYNVFGHKKLLPTFHPITESAAQQCLQADKSGLGDTPENLPSK